MSQSRLKSKSVTDTKRGKITTEAGVKRGKRATGTKYGKIQRMQSAGNTTGTCQLLEKREPV